MENPLILVIDDNATTRKVVETHLSSAGYRVVMAADADKGLELARARRPDLILLDHQLPGTTGDQVCRKLLETEATAGIPVVISSAMRSRAFAQYADFPNVVDQIPKPYTPELLKGGVGNALATGALVVQSQRTGSALPEQVDVEEAALQGDTSVFSPRSVFDFLNNGRHQGRLTVEVGQDRFRFALGNGRVQAAYSATVGADRLAPLLPPELSDLSPLLMVTLAETQDAQMSGLVKLLEQSLSDPRRLRALLRAQASILTYWAVTGEAGGFSFDPGGALPPMFQAFPLQLSLPALIVEGSRRCDPTDDPASWGGVVLARFAARGANLDRTGLAPVEMKFHASLDGTRDLATVARAEGIDLDDAAALAQGLEMAGLVERRHVGASILVLEDDPETLRVIHKVLEVAGQPYQVKFVRDRVGAQLMLRRNQFDLVLMALDRPEQEQFFQASRAQAPASTRFVGLSEVRDEGELIRLGTIGLDGVVQRPVSEADLSATVEHLMESNALAKVS